jgi:hypothetical protein
MLYGNFMVYHLSCCTVCQCQQMLAGHIRQGHATHLHEFFVIVALQLAGNLTEWYGYSRGE